MRLDAKRLNPTHPIVRPASTRPPRDERVVVVTMVRARDAEESACLMRGLRALARWKLPIYVGESGSLPEFTDWLRGEPQLHVTSLEDAKPCLVNQLKPAFRQARQADPEWVLYTEPDKGRFFQLGLGKLLHRPRTIEPAPGLILAGRTPRGFRTFPEGQRAAESMMNGICSEVFGQTGDYTYGPMLIHRSLLGYTDVMPENLGWGWRFFLLALAHQTRRNVSVCPVGHECPREQRGEDDPAARAYRLGQLIDNVTGLANGWTFLLDHSFNADGELVEAA